VALRVLCASSNMRLLHANLNDLLDEAANAEKSPVARLN
jgi:hypothetical protein